MRLLATALVFGLFAGLSPGQTVHVVDVNGPLGTFWQIQHAIDAAADGDVILVRPGFYWWFLALGVDVTIRAETPGTVMVGYPTVAAPNPSPTTFAECEVHVVGLSFEPSVVSPFQSPVNHTVSVFDSVVTFDDCQFRSAGGTSLVVFNSRANLQDCVVESVSTVGQGIGLAVENSDVTAVGGEFLGSSVLATGGSFSNGHGILLSEDSHFHGSGFTALGGLTPVGGSAAVLASPTNFWASDAVLEGGPGACALESSGPLNLDRCTVIDNGTGCVGAAPGVSLVGVTRSGPIVIGATFSVDYKTAPFGMVTTLVSTDTASVFLPQIITPALWLDPALLINAGGASADANGDLTVSWSVPATPALVDQRYWFQGVSPSTIPFSASPVVGGVIR